MVELPAERLDFAPELFPASGALVERTQRQHRLQALALPLHPAAGHALFDHVLARGFDDSAADGQLQRPVHGVVHAPEVVAHITFGIHQCGS